MDTALAAKKISVVIVTQGKGGYLASCLESLDKQSLQPQEAIIIDNSSGRLGAEISLGLKLQTQIFTSPENLFYCAALNKGIGLSGGDFVLCLNDDIVLDRDFLKEALPAFSRDEKIGMASGKILRYGGRVIDSAGLFLTPWRSARERGYGRKDEGQYQREEYIYGVNGAAALYRRSMLEQIKIGPEYFDSAYRIFYEDLDMAWRAQNAGWKAYYMPLAVAYHARGATVRFAEGTGKPFGRRYLSEELQFDLIKNRYLTIIKNESLPGLILHLPFILLYDFFAWGYILFFRPLLIKKFILNIKTFLPAFRKRKLLRRTFLRRKN